MRRIAVGDIMTRNFVHSGPKHSIYDCAKIMTKERVNSLLITNHKKLVGIITARDILWTLTKKPGIDLRKINVMEIATKKVAVIKPSSEISEAIEKMKMYNFRRLPVISRGEIIGVVTLKDILAVDPSLYSEMSALIDVRERERKIERDDEWPEAGFCDNCGTFAELLKVENRLLCPDCRYELY